MNTLAVVELVLMEFSAPVTVKQIVQRAGARLPSKSRTPETVVARDLSMDIKRLGEQSRFVRTAPGLYALRAPVAAAMILPPETTDLVSAALRQSSASSGTSSAPMQLVRTSSQDQEMAG